MPTLPGPRVLLSNSQDSREQAIPGYYVEKELAVMYAGSDGTGFEIDVATAGTPAVLLKASGLSTDSIGDITVDATTGAFTVSKKGKYLCSLEGSIKGENSSATQLSVLKNGTEVAASLRTWTEPGTALFQSRGTRVLLDLVPGDVIKFATDQDTNGDDTTFDGFSACVELVESQE